MAARQTFFQSAFYTVALTGMLMLPAAAILWWMASYIEIQIGTGSNGTQNPGTYIRYAAAALVTIGLLLTGGAIAFAKKAAAGKYILATGCCAAVVISLWPVIDFIAVAPRWWIVAAASLGWLIFSSPYAALFWMLRRR